MRYCVTGGAGFIGSWVCEKLIAEGHDVLVIDDLSRGHLDNIDHIRGRFEFKEMSLLDKGLKGVLLSFRPDAIIHLAAVHYIPEVNAFPERAIRTNVAGTEAVCSIALQTKCKRLFVASSAAVYGISEQPHDEDEQLDPPDLYGLTKFWSENLARLAARHGNLSVIIGRFFNTYGPRETNHHLIPHVLSSIKLPYIPLGNLESRRSYTYVTDMAHAVVSLCEVPMQNGLETINICSSRCFSVLEVLDVLREIQGKDIEYRVEPERTRSVDAQFLRGKTEKLNKLGIFCKTGLQEGLQKTLDSGKILHSSLLEAPPSEVRIV